MRCLHPRRPCERRDDDARDGQGEACPPVLKLVDRWWARRDAPLPTLRILLAAMNPSLRALAKQSSLDAAVVWIASSLRSSQ